jgi:hypothetical protein
MNRSSEMDICGTGGENRLALSLWKSILREGKKLKAS